VDFFFNELELIPPKVIPGFFTWVCYKIGSSVAIVTTSSKKKISKGKSPALKLPSLPWTSWALLIAGGALAFHPVSVTWSNNPNYSFGWLIPFVALFLFSERWPKRPHPGLSAKGLHFVLPIGLGGCLFFFLRLAAEADPDWRPGLWLMIGLYVWALLSWLWIYGGWPWVRHFAFPVCFLFLGLPWLFQIEFPLVQGLMRLNTMLVANSLHLLDISAEAAGNIIRLPNCELGVEEACCGILSLQASLMMGCLLGEIYWLTIRRRILLVAACLAFALIGNYGRTLFLSLVAVTNGVESVARWHDTAGFSILVFTALSAWVACLFLKIFSPVSIHNSSPLPVKEKGYVEQAHLAQRMALTVFLVLLLAEAGTQAWFGWRELKIPRHPQWIVNLAQSESFKEITVPEVTLQALQCDFNRTGQWQDRQGWNWTAYWFGYKPKAYNKVIMGWHNPDKCLPSAGLTKDQDYPDFTASINGIDFYVQPRKFFMNGIPVYIFWLVYPISGSLPHVINNQADSTFTAKFRSHFRDLWQGNRGVGVETLEVALQGPTNYEAAKASYLAMLKDVAMPSASIESVASKNSH